MSDIAVVHLIDDDERLRDALAVVLTKAGFAVRVYEAANRFLDELPTIRRGCVVTDMQMPGIDGLELQRLLNARHIDVPIIVMTGHGDVPSAVTAMKAGAVEFIQKPFKSDVLVSAIRNALDRQAKDLSLKEDAAALQTRLKSLSAREREVLDRMLLGEANKTIAHNLNISSRTVEAHRAKVMTKMGVPRFSELMRMLLTAGPTID